MAIGSGQFTILIDATALSAPELILSGLGNFSTQTPQSFNLDPVVYSLAYYTAVVPGVSTAAVVFTVTESGTVDFDPSLDGILGGRVTSTLS